MSGRMEFSVEDKRKALENLKRARRELTLANEEDRFYFPEMPELKQGLTAKELEDEVMQETPTGLALIRQWRYSDEELEDAILKGRRLE